MISQESKYLLPYVEISSATDNLVLPEADNLAVLVTEEEDSQEKIKQWLKTMYLKWRLQYAMTSSKRRGINTDTGNVAVDWHLRCRSGITQQKGTNIGTKIIRNTCRTSHCLA